MRKLILIALLFIFIPCARLLAQHHTGSHAHHSSSHHSHSHHSVRVRSHGERHHVHRSGHGYNSFLFFRRGGYGHSGGDVSFRQFAPLKGIHDISVGIGGASAWQITDNYVTTSTPNYFASYRYFVSNRVALGISAGTQTIGGQDSSMLPGKGPLYSFRTTTYTVALEFSWIWYTWHACQVYGCIAGGVSYFSEFDRYPDMTSSTYTGYKFNGQLTIAGLRIGRTLGGFAELGFGYKGLLSAGISYQPGYRRAHKQS